MFTFIGILFVSAIGTLLHFLYDMTNHNKIVGLFAAVNESTWEHIKIALTPTFLWSVVDGIIYGSSPNYFLAKLLSVVTIIILIPVLFYGYKHITKKDNYIINILIFYITIIISQILFKVVINLRPINNISKYLSCIGLFIIFGYYMVLTLIPIKNFIFRDPISKKYGFKGHTD